MGEASDKFYGNIFARFILSLPAKFLVFLTMPLLTRTYTRSEYAAWSQVLTLMVLFSVLLSLRFETVLVRFLSSAPNQEKLIRSTFTLTLMVVALFVAAALGLDRTFSYLLFGTEHYHALVMVAAGWLSLKGLMQVGLSVLRAREQIVKLTLIELASAALLMVSVTVAFLIDLPLKWLLGLCLLGDALVLLYLYFQMQIGPPLAWPRQALQCLRRYLAYCWPLNLNSVLLWFTHSIDRFFVVHLLALGALGPYSVSLSVANITGLILMPVNYVLFPRASKVWNQNNPTAAAGYFSGTTRLIYGLGFPLMVGVTLISDDLIRIFTNRGYVIGKEVVFILCLASILKVFYNNRLYALHLMEKTLYLPLLFLCTSLCNFLLCYLTVGPYGVMGVAFSRMISIGLMMAIVVYAVNKLIKIDIDYVEILKVGLGTVIMGVVLFFFPKQNLIYISISILTSITLYIFIMSWLRVIRLHDLYNFGANLLSSKTAK